MTEWAAVRRQAEHGDEASVLDLMRLLWADKSDLVARRTQMRPLLKEVCRRVPSVRAHFLALRDAFTPEFEAQKGVIDWLDLNEVLDERSRTLAWFDEACAAGRRPREWATLGAALRERGRAADFLWLLEDGAVGTVRGMIATYLFMLSLKRGQACEPDTDLEVLLARIPLADRRPRDQVERSLERECAQDVAPIISASESVDPGDASLRNLVDELLDSEVVRDAIVPWSELQTRNESGL